MSQTLSTQATSIAPPQQPAAPVTSVHRVEADGVRVFYRSAGDTSAPVLLLLHGFPTSSFMFRDLIPRLADQYRVIAPDLPGFGFTEVPEKRKYKYSFEALARTIEAFADALSLNRYAIYVFDYGAPTGLRLAMAHPERVTAIVSQNGNAYEEGLGDAWGPIRKYWSEPTAENREVLRQNILTFEGTRWQYTHGVANPETIAPESYTLDTALFERPGNKEIQLDLFLAQVERDAPFISFHLANELPVDLDFKQALLEMKSEADRIETLTEYYRATIPKVEQTLRARERASRNGHAH
jgi:pimeloyl-ACP methyl ester carboxylesterase